MCHHHTLYYINVPYGTALVEGFFKPNVNLINCLSALAVDTLEVSKAWFKCHSYPCSLTCLVIERLIVLMKL